MKTIDLKKVLLPICVWALFIYEQGMAQKQISTHDSTKAFTAIHDSAKLNKIDSLAENISSQLKVMQQNTNVINETVEKIDKNTDDGILVEGAKNLLFTFIYELLGYKSGSSAGWFSKFISVISFLFLLFRIFFYFNKKDKEYPKLIKAINIYLVVIAVVALLLPWTATLFPNKEMDKEQILNVTKNAKKLNLELTKIQSADFKRLVDDIQKLKELRIDTIQLAKESSLKAVQGRFNLIQSQIILSNKKLDGLHKKISAIKKDENSAKRKLQIVQTWLIAFTFLMIAIFFIFFISKKPWNN